MIKSYIDALMAHARTEPTDYGDGESVLTMLTPPLRTVVPIEYSQDGTK